jgi:hypothetical protein
MPMLECTLKMQRIELEQEQHAKKIGYLFKKQADTDKALRDIRDIKYILIGGFGFYLLDKIGFVETVMKFFG